MLQVPLIVHVDTLSDTRYVAYSQLTHKSYEGKSEAIENRRIHFVALVDDV